MIKIKRAYDPPARGDGKRFLVDRLWPRGMTKAKLELDDWLKDVAPSNALRKRFHHNPTEWDEFQRQYFTELDAHPDVCQPILQAARRGTVTLVYGARDIEHNNAVALKAYLEKK